MRAAFALVALVLVAGCVTPGGEVEPNALGADAALDGYPTWRGWSMPLSPALYGILDAVNARVPSFDGVEMAIGIFLPEMEGCDWSAAELPDACKLPIVMDAGPYYGANVDVDKLRPPSVEWLVPRGYAVVQMSLRGSGESDGCLEFKNPGDAQDISAVIDWLAAQPWSNGNVGMTGRSYDGTSAWAGAASGNPHLKTIVPISGAVNGPFLYYKNGTTESRGRLNGATYFPTYATDAKGPQEWPQRLCEGALLDAHRESAYASATGDASSDFWQSRDLRPDILQNYNGSVWVIHGLEDWNVNPSQAVPFVNEMQDAGIPVHAWLGVWGHAYPDRIDEHRNVRWDWAERMVLWFDYWLKGEGAQPPLHVEVEDSLFTWRIEQSYPPRDATPLLIDFQGQSVSAQHRTTFTTDPFENATRIAGLPRVHFEATPTTPTGGHVFAEMFDVWPDGRSVRIGWGGINLQHHAGGNGPPTALTPMQAVTAHLEMEPVDALVAQGHRLRLVLHKAGVEDVEASPDPSVVMIGASTLELPTVERATLLPVYAPVVPQAG